MDIFQIQGIVFRADSLFTMIENFKNYYLSNVDIWLDIHLYCSDKFLKHIELFELFKWRTNVLNEVKIVADLQSVTKGLLITEMFAKMF